MMQPGIWDHALILVIAIIIFGVGKLPELGGALGKGIREFRQATKTAEDATEEVKQAVDDAKEEAEKEA